MRPCSHTTLETSMQCRYCHRWLKQAEEYFYYDVCSECRQRELADALKIRRIDREKSK
jgi:hypothetical protein